MRQSSYSAETLKRKGKTPTHIRRKRPGKEKRHKRKAIVSSKGPCKEGKKNFKPKNNHPIPPTDQGKSINSTKDRRGEEGGAFLPFITSEIGRRCRTGRREQMEVAGHHSLKGKAFIGNTVRSRRPRRGKRRGCCAQRVGRKHRPLR